MIMHDDLGVSEPHGTLHPRTLPSQAFFVPGPEFSCTIVQLFYRGRGMELLELGRLY